MINKYNEGETVFAKVHPDRGLIVRRFIKDIYYCRPKDDIKGKDLVYFERELMSESDQL